MGDPDKIAIFRADHKTNMAAIGSCGLWLGEVYCVTRG
jgi:hypothetical protein